MIDIADYNGRRITVEANWDRYGEEVGSGATALVQNICMDGEELLTHGWVQQAENFWTHDLMRGERIRFTAVVLQYRKFLPLVQDDGTNYEVRYSLNRPNEITRLEAKYQPAAPAAQPVEDSGSHPAAQPVEDSGSHYTNQQMAVLAFRALGKKAPYKELREWVVMTYPNWEIVERSLQTAISLERTRMEDEAALSGNPIPIPYTSVRSKSAIIHALTSIIDDIGWTKFDAIVDFLRS